MTTPITAFQIVVGKLVGGLFQTVLLLAVSLPLLVLVRVFGGVPWEFVVAGLCLTLATTLFAGSLSLCFSMGSRRAYWVVLETLVALFVLFVAIPWIGETAGLWSEAKLLDSPLGWINPYPALMEESNWLTYTPASAANPHHYCRDSCLALLAGSALLVAASVLMIRRVALRELSSEGRISRRARRSKTAATGTEGAAGTIRRVRGSPVVWRELRTRLMPSRRYAAWGTILVVGLMVAGYVAAGANIGTGDFQSASALVLVALGLVTTAVVAATGITSEKEAGSWPILLATPLGRDHILLGKAAGVARRSLPAWMLLGAHAVFCVAAGYMHPMVGLLLAVISFGAAVFLTGSGLFFGAVCRRTTTAVILNLALALAVWVAGPYLAMEAHSVIPEGAPYAEASLCAHPWLQVAVVTERVSPPPNGDFHTESGLSFRWPPPINTAGVAVTEFIVVGTAALHAYLGLALAALAGVRMRRAARI
jgi:ABC-type transport system involved in multi-copper enzyme maturation permease subunit